MDMSNAATPTEADAVAVVEGALANDAGGVTGDLEDALSVAHEYTAKSVNPCGVPQDSSITKTVNRPNFTASYSTDWSWTLNCTNNVFPVSLDFARTAEGSYTARRLQTTDAVASAWLVDDLGTSPNWTINGTHNRMGDHQSLVGEQHTFSSDADFTFANIAVRKDDFALLSGSGSFTVALSGTGGGSRTWEGSITFLGDGEARIVLNGETYLIELDQ